MEKIYKLIYLAKPVKKREQSIKSINKSIKSRAINKTRNEGEIVTNTIEIQRIIRDYCQQLYTNKMDNLEEMDKFLEIYTLPRLSQEEIENMNRPITSNEIESVI